MNFPNGLKITLSEITKILIIRKALFRIKRFFAYLRLYDETIIRIFNAIILFIIMIIALEILSVTKNRLGKIQENTGSITISQDELNLFMKKSLTLGKIGEELPASKPIQWGF